MSSSSRTLTDLASFAVVLLAAWVARWTPGDLAWGLWVAGFLTVLAWLFLSTLLQLNQDGLHPLPVAGTFAAMALIGWAFAWVYGFYGELLDLGFPLVPDPGRVQVSGTTWLNVRPFETWPMLIEAARHFYVVVIISLLPIAAALRRAWPDADRFRLDPGISGGAIARMHFTVMALIVLQIALQEASARHAFVFSAVILLINYFPWAVVVRRPTRVAPPRLSRAPGY